MSPRGRGMGRGLGGRGRGMGGGGGGGINRLRDGSCRGGSTLSGNRSRVSPDAIKVASTLALPLLKLAGKALLVGVQRLLNSSSSRSQRPVQQIRAVDDPRQIEPQRARYEEEIIDVESEIVEDEQGRLSTPSEIRNTKDDNLLKSEVKRDQDRDHYL